MNKKVINKNEKLEKPAKKKEPTRSPKKAEPNIVDKADDQDLEKLKMVGVARKKLFFQAAKDMLQEILNRRPKWELARKELLELYIAAENYLEAKKFIASELEQDPKNKLNILQSARIERLLGNVPAQIQQLKNALALEKDEKLARSLFVIQRDAGDIEGALSTVLYLRDLRDTTELEVAHAKLLSLAGKKDDAYTLCEKLVNKSPMPEGVIELWTALNLADKNQPEEVIKKIPLLQSQIIVWFLKKKKKMDSHNLALQSL